MIYSIIITFAVIFLFWKIFQIEKRVESSPADVSVKENIRGFERVFLPLKKVVLFNFMGGMAWGLGAFLGATILVGILIIIFDMLGGVPLIGNLIENVFHQVDVMNGI